jgi:hypothetical protein
MSSTHVLVSQKLKLTRHLGSRHSFSITCCIRYYASTVEMKIPKAYGKIRETDYVGGILQWGEV